MQTQAEIKWDGEYQVEVDYAIKGATEATDQSAELSVTAGGESVGGERLGWDQRRTIRLTGKVGSKVVTHEYKTALRSGEGAGFTINPALNGV